MEYTDLFISYRRSHATFIRQLHDALVARKRSVWVDWEDILPGSTDFTVDIQQGIERANAFIAVLTADYLASEYCLNELNHAISNHKRLLPIVLEEIDAKQAPSAISHINWIYFLDHAGNTYRFEDALNQLVSALDVDQEYLTLHTNLQVRAKEWAAHNRVPDFTLIGAPLVEAEKFIGAGINKQPRPTDLQAEYVVASRAAETKRQQHEKTLQNQARIRLRLSMIMLAVTLVLTLGGFVWFFGFTQNVVLKLAQNGLSTLVQAAADGIDGDQLRELVSQVRAGQGPIDDPRYLAELAWLTRMHDINPGIMAYTYVRADNGEIAYVADDKQIFDRQHSHGYLDTEQRPADDAIWRGLDQPTVSLDVSHDQNGAWISAYAPIKDSSGDVVGAAGLDMRLDEFMRPLNDLLHIVEIVAVVLVITAIIGVSTFFIVRSRQKQALKGVA